MTVEAVPFVTMAKPIGAACNLACSYCYYLDRASLFPSSAAMRMGEEVLEAYVASAIAAHPGPVVPFVWHGGEPTLAGLDHFRRVVDVQARHLPEGWSALNNLQTNGTRLDDRWCAFLAEHGFSVGLSLDGPPHLHDACRRDPRGSPSAARALQGLRMLRDHGIEPDVLCTLNARNVGHPLEVYHFFVDAGVRWLQFLPVVRRTGNGVVDPCSAPPEAPGEFLTTLFDEWVRYDVDRISIQTFQECLIVLSGATASLCVMAETCGHVPAVEHDGSVYSCDHFVDAEHRLGDVVSDGLASLLGSTAQAAFGRGKRDALPSTCRACPVLALCHGGCPKDRFVTAPGGEPGLNYLCPSYRRLYAHVKGPLGRMAALLKVGRRPGEVMDELRREEPARPRVRVEPNRNDPCPCGSGFKHKRCCLPYRKR